jgi:phosphatidylglycerophosphatase A
LLATGFGVGYSPLVPGTAGTLLAVPVHLFFSCIPTPLYELTLLTFFFFSSWVSKEAERFWGKKDDRRIIIDEILGYLVTMLWVPLSPFSIVTGFILFRFFDILKPYPIRHLERVKYGFGVVLDDVMAGICSNIILRLLPIVTLSLWRG